MTSTSNPCALFWPRIFVILSLMLAIAAGLIFYVSLGKNVTLVRNSLIAKPYDQDAFLWQPGSL